MVQVRLSDCLLYCSERGSGRPLLLLMGLGGSHRSWGEPFLSELAGSFRVLALDYRGTGRSTRGTAEYTIPRLADDAAEAMSKLGIGSADVFGISMGGMVAQELALRHPDCIDGLVLASTTCGGRHAVWPSAAARRHFLEGVVLGDAVWPLVVTPEFAARNGAFLRRIAWETLTAGTPPSVLREQSRAIGRFSTYDRLPMIEAPTLVMTGESDLLIPPVNAQTLQRRILRAQGVVVRRAGHVFVWEAPERAAAEVVRFLTPSAPRRERRALNVL